MWKLTTAKTPIMFLEATSALCNQIARVTTTAKNTKRALQGSINAILGECLVDGQQNPLVES